MLQKAGVSGRRKGLRRSFLAGTGLLLPAGLAFLLARLHPAWMEAYAEKIYPIWAAPLGRAVSRLPFSLSEFGLYILALWVLYLPLAALVRAKRGQSARLAPRLAGLWTFACALVLIFTLSFGVLYARLPLEERLGIAVGSSTAEELDRLVGALIEQANEYAGGAPEPPQRILARVDDAFEQAAAALAFLPEGRWGNPKAAYHSDVLSRLLVEGIYSPFTCEAHVNDRMPPHTIAFTACHEAAHLRGFAREDEANLVAFLVCMASGDAAYQYSAAMGALQYALPALAKEDGARYAVRMGEIAEAVMGDMRVRSQFWAPYRASARGNGYTLGISSAQAGVERVIAAVIERGPSSYGRMVDLLLAIMREDVGILR